jgi:hypothetical protein
MQVIVGGSFLQELNELIDSFLIFSCDELEYCAHEKLYISSSLPLLYKDFKQLHSLHLEYFCTEGNNFGDLVVKVAQII